MKRSSALFEVLFCCALCSAAAVAAEPNVPTESEGHELPELTVSAPAEADYTTLPERDLIERPYTESPGLETATSVVGRKEIDELHAYSVVDALKYVPGAWTETRGRKVKSFYSVRGQRYPYPGYLIDGAWFREFHEINYYLSAANFDRIEVLRSSSALLAGPGGLTGMVNLVPRTYEERETQFEGLYGTHNTYRTDLTHGDQGATYDYGVSAGYYHTDGPTGKNAVENMTNLYGRFAYQLAEDVTFSWSHFGLLGDRELMLAEPPANPRLQTRRDEFDPMRTYLTVAKLRHEPTSESATEFLVNYGERRFSGERDTPPSEWLEEDYEYGTSIIHSRQLTENNTLRFGGLFNRWVSPTGKRFYVGNPADIRTYSGVIVDDHDFGRLDTSIGYRYTREHWREFGGFNVEGSPRPSLIDVTIEDEWSDPLHTGNLGASYELTTDVCLFGNLGWGQIAAQPGMLTGTDPNDLSIPDTENRWKFDLGVRKHFAELGQASLTGFFVRRDNAAILTGETVPIGGEDVGLFEEADRKNYGVELDLRSRRFANGLQCFFNATIMETERSVDGDWEDDEEVPNVVLGGGLSYLFDRFEAALFAHHLAEYENERFLPSGSDPVALGDFTDIKGIVTYHYDATTELYVRVDNITDDEYSTVAGYPNDGTQVFGGLVKRF